MPYLMYLRKSRADVEAEAHGAGDTLARHQDELLRAAKRLNLPVSKIYREIVSGDSIAARPVMQQLLDEVERGMWEGVLVVEVERLARGDTIDQGIVAQAFKLSHTKIVTPAKIYDPNNEFDEEYFEFGLFMSRREYKTINRRLQRGRVASVMEGKYTGNIPPYGYTRVKLQNEKGWTLEPDPEEAETVRLIFELYTLGATDPDGTTTRLGSKKIANRLNDLHIPTRKGGLWTYNSVVAILENPVYCGQLRWNRRPGVKSISGGDVKISRPKKRDYIVTQGRHEPIISRETWDAAQENITHNPPIRFDAHKQMRNPLAGLLVCGVCGHMMVRRPYANRQASMICQYPGCPNVSADLPLILAKVRTSLQEWLEEYRLSIEGVHDKKPAGIEAAEKSVRRLEKELATLDHQLSKAHDLLEQEIYSVEIFLSRTQSISSRRQELQNQLDELQREADTYRQAEAGRKKIIPKVENLLNVFDSTMDPAQLNQLLKEVIDKIVYTKARGGRHGDPSDFKVDLFMRLP